MTLDDYISAQERYRACILATDQAVTPNEKIAAELAEWMAEQAYDKARYDAAENWLFAKRQAYTLFPDDCKAVNNNDLSDLAGRVVILEQSIQRIANETNEKIAALTRELELAQAQRDAALRAAHRPRNAIQVREKA